jgi:hypothetical protein
MNPQYQRKIKCHCLTYKQYLARADKETQERAKTQSLTDEDIQKIRAYERMQPRFID